MSGISRCASHARFFPPSATGGALGGGSGGAAPSRVHPRGALRGLRDRRGGAGPATNGAPSAGIAGQGRAPSPPRAARAAPGVSAPKRHLVRGGVLRRSYAGARRGSAGPTAGGVRAGLERGGGLSDLGDVFTGVVLAEVRSAGRRGTPVGVPGGSLPIAEPPRKSRTRPTRRLGLAPTFATLFRTSHFAGGGSNSRCRRDDYGFFGAFCAGGPVSALTSALYSTSSRCTTTDET